jgi:hypothetical protein
MGTKILYPLLLACVFVSSALAAAGPAAPDGVAAVRYMGYFGGWFANVRWNDNSNDEDGFAVEWQGPHGESGIVVVAANSTAAFGLPSGRSFKYRVRAFNAASDSRWSQWAVPSGGGVLA